MRPWTQFRYPLFLSQGEPGSKDVYKAVLAALDAGYRHFDTAEVYKTEEDIGKAVAEKIKAGEVKREELFLTTKVKKLKVDNFTRNIYLNKTWVGIKIN